MVRAMYGIACPSLRRSGHILWSKASIVSWKQIDHITRLNTATLLTNTPSSNVSVPWPDPARSRVKGNNGTKMVFSWTWNANKKNDIDVLSNAYGSSGSNCDVVLDSLFWFLSWVAWTRSFHEDHSSTTTLGAKPTAVSKVLSLTSWFLLNQSFHLKMTFVAHQKLATLSSNKPRAKGNILVIGYRMAERAANGGRNGRKRIRNVREVDSARLINKMRL